MAMRFYGSDTDVAQVLCDVTNWESLYSATLLLTVCFGRGVPGLRALVVWIVITGSTGGGGGEACSVRHCEFFLNGRIWVVTDAFAHVRSGEFAFHEQLIKDFIPGRIFDRFAPLYC